MPKNDFDAFFSVLMGTKEMHWPGIEPGTAAILDKALEGSNANHYTTNAIAVVRCVHFRTVVNIVYKALYIVGMWKGSDGTDSRTRVYRSRKEQNGKKTHVGGAPWR